MIDVTVRNGVVQLSGILTDERQRQALRVAAEKIPYPATMMRSRFSMNREITPSSLSRPANTTNRLATTTKMTAKYRWLIFSPIGDRPASSGASDCGFALHVPPIQQAPLPFCTTEASAKVHAPIGHVMPSRVNRARIFRVKN